MRKAIAAVALLLAFVVMGGGYWLKVRTESDVRRAIAGLPAPMRGSCGEVSFSLLDRSLIVKGLVMLYDEEGKERLETALVKAAPVSWGVILGYFAGGKPMEVAGSVTASGISYADGGSRVTAGEVRLERPMLPGELPPSLRDMKGKLNGEHVAEMLKLTKADKIETSNVAVTVQGEEKTSLAVTTMTMTGLDQGSLERLEVSGIKVAEDGKPLGGLDRLTATKLRLARLASLAEKKEVTPVALFEGFALNGLEAVSGESTVRVGEISLAGIEYLEEMPIASGFTLRGLDMEVAAVEDEEARDVLRGLGYERLGLDFEVAYAWDPKTRVMNVRSLTLAAAEMGEIRMSLALGNVDLPALAKAADPEKVLSGLTLNSAELSYVDRSLVERILAQVARDVGVTAAEARAGLIQGVRVDAGELAESPFGLEVLQSVEAFLEKPGTFRITLAPSAPLDFRVLLPAAMLDPMGLPEVLGVKVTAEPPALPAKS